MRLKVTLLTTLDAIRTSFWFIPILMVISSICAAVLLAWLDKYSPVVQLQWLNFAYEADATTIRSLLNTIAGSMITVTSIAFSITIVTLTLASSQFGPRLIRTFMMDRGTQFVLGAFISNFSYCLILLYVMSLASYQGSALGVAILWCLFTTLASVCVLIYFIHHVASAIQVDTVIDDVYRELVASVEKFSGTSANRSKSQKLAVDQEGLTETAISEVTSNTSGYVQLVDSKGLLSEAEKFDVCLKVIVGPGDFVVQNSAVIKVYSHDKLDSEQIDKLSSKLTIGGKRTPVQDPEYAVHQLVEIAVRALSPGVNDPFTALTCVDKLSAVLCGLCERDLPSGFLSDKDDICRVSHKTINFSSLGEAAFNQIRQFSTDSTAVTIRLLEALCRIAMVAETDEQRQFVESQTAMISEQISDCFKAREDKNDVTKRINEIRSQLSAMSS